MHCRIRRTSSGGPGGTDRRTTAHLKQEGRYGDCRSADPGTLPSLGAPIISLSGESCKGATTSTHGGGGGGGGGGGYATASQDLSMSKHVVPCSKPSGLPRGPRWLSSAVPRGLGPLLSFRHSAVPSAWRSIPAPFHQTVRSLTEYHSPSPQALPPHRKRLKRL